MLLGLAPGEELETRTLSSRRPRWRAGVPGAALAAAGALVLLAPPDVVGALQFGFLTPFGALVVFGALLVVLSTGCAWVARRHPLPTLLVGAFALSLGANLTHTPWLGLPILVAGVAWLGALEAARALNGLALTNRRIVLPRPLRKPLAIPYDAVRAVHTTGDGVIGSLILETSHGTLAAPDLPGAAQLEARIKVRMARTPVVAEPASMAEARSRIERIVAGRSPRGGGGGGA